MHDTTDAFEQPVEPAVVPGIGGKNGIATNFPSIDGWSDGTVIFEPYKTTANDELLRR